MFKVKTIFRHKIPNLIGKIYYTVSPTTRFKVISYNPDDDTFNLSQWNKFEIPDDKPLSSEICIKNINSGHWKISN